MASPSGGTLSRNERVSRLEAVIDPALARAMEPSERIAISSVRPSADGGVHVKRTEGDTLRIEADIICDGHGLLAAAALVRREGSLEWTRAGMHPLGNDRYAGEVRLSERGIYDFVVEAWLDVYGGFARDLEKKRVAGLDIAGDLEEGRTLIAAAHEGAPDPIRQALDAVLHGVDTLGRDERAQLLAARETVSAMSAIDRRPFLARSEITRVEAERKRARYGSWYELFPRSQNSGLGGHGTFQDVIAELPRIAAMGFDVLYMPPIHPIGTTNRKGKNNSLSPAADDPGSPYAIGSVEGGHDAIHPELGTFEDFEALLDVAREHDIEIALDFAVQCSPDHPWLKAHPGWFDWRADGSIKFAENPPKKYEDIVNVDFYAPDAAPGLWLALRDVVLFWIERGVKIFRVDNPHTKPFPFWRWLIADVRAHHPETIFLAEAFTRPKTMLELAKIGFTQSYTYFTWRNTKAELTEYLTELNTAPAADVFRPNFFVNTPDINPIFLQSRARAAFLIRAALAASLSGSWGMYSGFELCEHEPLPGREEYKNSEKYEIKARDWSKQGNIEGEIAALNAVRRREPALQTHLGITFHNAFNDNVLYFEKHAPGGDDRILVIVSLDPFSAQECDFEIPLWQWNLPDHESLEAEDLLYGYRFTWTGKNQHIRLEPSAPYRIWRVRPAGPA
jgi:starch synthase (maltosyl-transferring)